MATCLQPSATYVAEPGNPNGIREGWLAEAADDVSIPDGNRYVGRSTTAVWGVQQSSMYDCVSDCHGRGKTFTTTISGRLKEAAALPVPGGPVPCSKFGSVINPNHEMIFSSWIIPTMTCQDCAIPSQCGPATSAPYNAAISLFTSISVGRWVSGTPGVRGIWRGVNENTCPVQSADTEVIIIIDASPCAILMQPGVAMAPNQGGCFILNMNPRPPAPFPQLPTRVTFGLRNLGSNPCTVEGTVDVTLAQI